MEKKIERKKERERKREREGERERIDNFLLFLILMVYCSFTFKSSIPIPNPKWILSPAMKIECNLFPRPTRLWWSQAEFVTNPNFVGGIQTMWKRKVFLQNKIRNVKRRVKKCVIIRESKAWKWKNPYLQWIWANSTTSTQLSTESSGLIIGIEDLNVN